MGDRCQVCGARFREDDAVKCHECGAVRRNTFLPEEPAGAPLPDAAASLATEPVVPGSSSTALSAASSSSMSAIDPLETDVTIVAPHPASSAVRAASHASSSAVHAVPHASPSAVQPVASHASSSAMAGAASAAVSAMQPVPPPGAAITPVAPAVSEPIVRSGRGFLLPMLGGALLTAGGLLSYYFLVRAPDPDPPTPTEQTPISISARGLTPPDCSDLEALGGSWVFATATTNARNESRAGMRGFFELQIQVKDCSAEATLTKVGRKGKPSFTDHKKPRAVARLTPGVGLYAFGFGGHFELKNEDNQGVPLRITLAREGEQLVGAWRQVGPRWETSGMYGVLVGERSGDPRKIPVNRKDQPCTIQCAAPEDIAEVDQPNMDTITACRSACG